MSQLILPPEPVLEVIDEGKTTRLPIVYELDNKVKLRNPFYERMGKFEDPYEEFADICLDNLTWAAYHLLVWKSKPLMLAPFQSVILDTLWNKTFPILLMTRGGGKCVYNATILTDKGIFLLDDNYKNDKKLFGESGFRQPKYVWKKEPEQTIKLTTQFGFNIEGTFDHPIRVLNENCEEVWKKLEDISTNDVVVINRNENYDFNGKYNTSEDEAYAIGALIGDGCLVPKTSFGFTNIDEDIINDVERGISSFYGKPKFNRLKRKGAFSITFGSRENKLKALDYYCLSEVKAQDKFIPDSILQSNKKCLAAFISGLFDTDGGVVPKGIEYSTKSYKLANQLQLCLLTFGIFAKLSEKKVKYNDEVRIYYRLEITREYLNNFDTLIGFRSVRKSKKLRELLCKKSNTNIDVIYGLDKKLDLLLNEFNSRKIKLGNLRRLLSPSRYKKYNYSFNTLRDVLSLVPQEIRTSSIYRDLESLLNKNNLYLKVTSIEKMIAKPTYDVYFDDEDHSFISNGFVSHNSFMLAVYACLRAMLTPGSKIIIVAASFRQSKIVFDYIENLFNSSPIMQACCPSGKIEKPSDSRVLRIGDSVIKALPLGNGEKIRGERACVDGETLIDTDRGLMKIRDVVEAQEDILIFNGEKYVKPASYLRTPIIDVHEVETMYGIKIQFSDIHRIMTVEGWKDINELSVNDRVPFSFVQQFPKVEVPSPSFSRANEKLSDYKIPTTVSEDVAKVLGYLVSEGNVTSNGEIVITTTSNEVVNDYTSAFERAFGIRPLCYQKPAQERFGCIGKPCFDIKINRIGIRNYIKEIGLDKSLASDKEVPWSILQSPKNVIRAFIQALFEGDGTAVLFSDKRRSSNEFYTAYYSVSEKLCRQLQTLISKFGLIGSLSSRESKLSDKPQWYLRFNGSQGIGFAEMIGFAGSEKTKICEAAKKIIKPFVFKNRSLKIKSIKRNVKRDVLYDFFIPDGHCFIGNGLFNHNTHIITDEFASIPPEIFQVVVRGFAAVSADPIAAARQRHEEERAIKEGRMKPGDRRANHSNQIIYSGTANFQFNHFYKLYKVHKDIIEGKFAGKAAEIARRHQSEDDENAIQMDGEVDYRDYAIVQIPYYGLPKSFMDDKQIAQAQATMPRALFDMEYCCVFPTDSDGFFKRSTINNATPGIGPGKQFSIETRGQAGCQYVMGIDPARKTDNFAISILKIINQDTFQNVYCGSMNNKSWPACIKRVRELLRAFNIVRIAVDSGGGGTTVEDLLQDEAFCEPGDQLIWRYNDDEHKRFNGQHILDMVNFAPGWIAEANYGLASDLEHRRILFPYRGLNSSDDTTDAEEVWSEIEEQKDEMCKITVTATKTGVQHFDVPELPTTQQGTLTSNQRKDRYSALLLSAYAARTYIVDNTIKNQVPSFGMWVDYA